jgi:hypothetical protein
MQDSLRLQIYLDDDGTAELFAEMRANGFCGHGSAWIDPAKITEIASQLAHAFPLSETLCVAGGYWSHEMPARLTQEHLAISFYPVEGRGVIGCQVRLATPLDRDDRLHSQHTVQAELLTSYQELQQFAKALGELSAGKAKEAVLNGVAV